MDKTRFHWVLLIAAAVVVALGGAKPAYSAAAITVDCTSNSGALSSALASASDGDTLSIQGTCKGTFEIAHSLTLMSAAGAILDGQGAGTVLTIDAGRSVVVSSLTITNGSGLVAGVRNNGGV